jgi:superfamily II DNA or RNA helicase
MELAGCRYRLGLSATLDRKDGMEKMLEHIVGPVAMHIHRTENPGIIVHMHPYTMQDIPPECNPSETTVSQALSITAADPERTAFVAALARQWHEQGRFIVIMSDRRILLESLATALADVGIAWAVGGETHAPDVSTRPIVLATYAFASEGMDIVELDTCLLATSRCELRQCVGRILRRSGHEPIVVDVVDTELRVLKQQAVKRRRWYKALLAKGGLEATVMEY